MEAVDFKRMIKATRYVGKVPGVDIVRNRL